MRISFKKQSNNMIDSLGKQNSTDQKSEEDWYLETCSEPTDSDISTESSSLCSSLSHSPSTEQISLEKNRTQPNEIIFMKPQLKTTTSPLGSLMHRVNRFMGRAWKLFRNYH